MSRRVIVWRVTADCDLACPFCGYARSVHRARRAARAEDAAAVGRLAGPNALVVLLGGEPLRYGPTFEIGPVLCRYGPEIAVTTHGGPLTDAKVRAHVLEYYAELTVSVDGVGDAHDRLRGVPGAFDNLERAIRGLVDARRGRVPLLRVNSILMRQTVRAFPLLCRTLASWGIDEITWNPLGGRERPGFARQNSLRVEDVALLAQVLPEVAREHAGRVRICGGPRYLTRATASASGTSLSRVSCSAEETMFVSEDGRVAPCAATVEEYGVSLDAYDDGMMMGLARRGERRAAACGDCPSTAFWGKFEEARYGT